MADYITEEQRFEALKSWWKENATAVIGGIILGVGALSGWRFWHWHQANQGTEASDLYAEVQMALIENDVTSLRTQSGILRDQYKSTPYAVLATLHEAKTQAEEGDLTAAAESLRWIIKHSGQHTIRDVARIRLARVLVADNKLDAAVAIVDREMPKAYTSLVDEIRGDIFVAKGKAEQARQAYDQALQAADAGSLEFLQMKRDNSGS